MTGMKQFHGRYSPGCGGRISERTLTAALQGEPAEQMAFEGYAPPSMPGSAQAWARPQPPQQEGWEPRRWVQRMIQRVQRWLPRSR